MPPAAIMREEPANCFNRNRCRLPCKSHLEVSGRTGLSRVSYHWCSQVCRHGLSTILEVESRANLPGSSEFAS
ncbi:hypothetical protein RRG08_004767 [Elysia crispata]|uniref:Uncharacterized protein n=1 Tax=Elysia crispata TaxID=231223 RepID=A0AAE1AKQ6_9GAST|nr:hypothetical protein RRG08_004767 [Elysia crispata]